MVSTATPAAPSYPLQTSATPKPRHQPPPPLKFHSTTTHSTCTAASPTSPTFASYVKDEPKFYDLTGNMVSPPSTPRGRIIPLSSPTSPTKSVRTPSKGPRPTPPPSRRNRSATPSCILDSDLDKFAEQCRAWYFKQDEVAGQLMTNTLSTVPPAQRAPYSRIQASVRSMYHRSVNARKTAEFQAHLNATLPGNSLMPHNRAAPASTEARKERLERFERFVRTWATHGMPGTTPFFEALWAIMRLQVVPVSLGGAGAARIEWELDDAVFKEAAGKDFMLEAVDVLKGVLGFEESGYRHVLPSRSASSSGPQPNSSQAPSTNKSIGKSKPPRESSDPFLDNPGLSNSVIISSSQSFITTVATTAALTAPETCEASTVFSPFDEMPPSSTPHSVLRHDSSQPHFNLDEEEGQLRVWLSADLADPEYVSLLKCFPTFVTRRSLPRFPIPSKDGSGGGEPDLEVGQALQEDSVENRIRFGTGSMWLGRRHRKEGWQGDWWSRFLLWWKRTFC